MNFFEENAGKWIDYINDKDNIEGQNNKVRLAYPIIDDMIPFGATLIDIGCGEGHFLRHIAPKIEHGVGIDSSKTLIKSASRFKSNLDYVVADGTDIPFSDDQFDVSLSMMTLLWLENYEDHLNEMFRVTKTQGIVAVPHPYSFHMGRIEEGEIRMSKGFHRGEEMISIADKMPKSRYFRRTVSDYVNACVKSGFKVESMAEPMFDLVKGLEHPYFLILNLKK